MNTVAIVATGAAQEKLEENRRRVRELLDRWALWKLSPRSGPRQSSIASIGQQLTKTGHAKPGQVAVHETRSFHSSIPQGVETSKQIMLVERARIDGDTLGLAKHMTVVRHCHYSGARNEATRERSALASIQRESGIVYHVRTLQTLRQIGEAFLMARLF